MNASKWLVAMTVIAFGILIATPSEARDLIFGSPASAKSTSNTITIPQYLEKIKKETGGEISFKLLAGGQVVTVKGAVDAVKNGTIDAAFVIPNYTPDALPATDMVFNTLMLGNDPIAAAGAQLETLLLHCAECIAEYKRNNAVVFASYALPPYLLLCTEPIKTVADLKGLKVRAQTSGIAIMNIAGATPVAITVSEGVESMQRGTVACSMAGLNWLTRWGYLDVTKYVLDYPMGMVGPALPFYLNRKVWDNMTPAQRKTLVENAPSLVATEMFDSQIASTEVEAKRAKQKGIVFFAGGEDFAAVMQQFDKSQRAQNVKIGAEHGVKNPQAILDAFDEAGTKWRRLSKQIGHDKAKFIQALKREVYDKIDPEKL